MSNSFVCQGRLVSDGDLVWLRSWIDAHPGWSRFRLAKELCMHWFPWVRVPHLASHVVPVKDIYLYPLIPHFKEALLNESGSRVLSKLHWLHVVCTKPVTWYGIHAKRGREAIRAFGLLLAYKGTRASPSDSLKCLTLGLGRMTGMAAWG